MKINDEVPQDILLLAQKREAVLRAKKRLELAQLEDARARREYTEAKDAWRTKDRELMSQPVVQYEEARLVELNPMQHEYPTADNVVEPVVVRTTGVASLFNTIRSSAKKRMVA